MYGNTLPGEGRTTATQDIDASDDPGDSDAVGRRESAWLSIPLALLRDARGSLRRWRIARRGWPTPVDVDRMSEQEFDAYLRRIGFDARIEAALRGPDPGAETHVDSRL